MRLTAAREAETKYISEQNELEIKKTAELAAIESDKFKQMVGSIGSETIQSIATAGPEMQVRVKLQTFIIITCFNFVLYRQKSTSDLGS